MEFKSNLDEVLREIEKAKKKKMVATGEHARNKVVEKLSGQRTGKTGYLPGGGAYTMSSPGEPPASAEGQLKESIDYTFNGDEVIIGSPIKYAPRMEFGFMGTDKLGRTYNQAARPFLRTTLKENEKDLIDILSGRWFD